MIKILVTGGTFDKDYDEKNGKLYFKDTHMSEILNLGRSKVEVSIKTLMMIDSLDMKDSNRKLIIDHCEKAIEKNIIITHGTDTMTKTANELGKKNINKTIVLTGAMIPYKFGTSDGLFNIASALAYVQTLSPGVYVAMNGRVFTYDNVIKNRETGVFEEKKMKHVKIYHNPRCSKSRKTLKIIRDHEIEPEVIEYLKKPPTKDELKKISILLGLKPKGFVRKNEIEFKENMMSEKLNDDEEMFRLMIEFPKVIERPIVISNNSAIIGRPPENVLKVLN